MTQVEAKNISGSTPLHVAAYYGSRDMIHLLMENGAKPLNKNKVFGCYVYLTNKVIILFILDSLRGHRLIPGHHFKTPCLKVDKCIQTFGAVKSISNEINFWLHNNNVQNPLIEFH